MPRLIIIILLFLLTIKSEAQDSSSIANIDEITYDLCLKQEWQQVINISENALSNHIDFDYLHYRLGISYFELKQYRKAMFHFEKAYKVFNSDQVLMEYLFYCYLFNDQYTLALNLSKNFTAETLKKTKMEEPSHVYFLHTEYGYKVADNAQTINKVNLYNPLNYFQAGMCFRFARDMTAYAGYSYLSQSNYDGSLTQNQFYASLSIPLKKSWVLSPAIHFVSLNFVDTNNATYPSSPFVLSINAAKSIKDYNINFGAAISNFNSKFQMQQDVAVTYFPLHNNSLSVSAGAIFYSDSTNHFKPLPFAGAKYKFTKSFTASVNYIMPNVTYFNEMNGYLVSNSADKTLQKINVTLDWRIKDNFGIYASYIQESKTAEIKTHDIYNNQLSYTRDYNFYMGLVGLRFTF